MVKIVIDAGHGLKCQSENDEEWKFNDTVVRAAIEKLKTYKDVKVLRIDDPSGKIVVSMTERARRANEWNADIYVSIHHGANLKPKNITAAFTPRIVKAMGDSEGGLKQTSFHVLRDTEFPAIYIGAGFSNSLVDIIKLCNESYLRAEGEAIAEGLAAYINLQPSHWKTKADSKKMKSKELVSAVTTILRHLESDRKGTIPQKWLENIYEGTLNDSDAIGLLYVVLHRWLISET
jgi:N-acetylmuramoyl-L-alanine amidase